MSRHTGGVRVRAALPSNWKGAKPMDIDELVDLVLKSLQAAYTAVATARILCDLWKERKHPTGDARK